MLVGVGRRGGRRLGLLPLGEVQLLSGPVGQARGAGERRTIRQSRHPGNEADRHSSLYVNLPGCLNGFAAMCFFISRMALMVACWITCMPVFLAVSLSLSFHLTVSASACLSVCLAVLSVYLSSVSMSYFLFVYLTVFCLSVF